VAPQLRNDLGIGGHLEFVSKRLRYADLVALGLVRNRVTLQNWILDRGFPPGQLTGPNSRTWGEGEVRAWLDSRPTAPKPTPRRRRAAPQHVEAR
jgi:predicted DNA-binding transcriptional regulator AlpA